MRYLDWLDDDGEDGSAFAAMRDAEAYLKEQFGERCQDYEPGCECCQRWLAFDCLFGEIDPSRHLIVGYDVETANTLALAAPTEPPHA